MILCRVVLQMTAGKNDGPTPPIKTAVKEANLLLLLVNFMATQK